MITHISPIGAMNLLSQIEADSLKATASSDLYRLYRNCSLAVLNSGSHTDNSKELLEKHLDFAINLLRRERGIKIELVNPPEHAFVDGRIIRGIQEHMFSVLRDIIYVDMHIARRNDIDLASAPHITDFVLVCYVMLAPYMQVKILILSYVGVAIPLTQLNTNIPVKSAMN